MAEVVATVASVLGIAGFAVQIAQTALRMKTLLDAIKDAPKDIKAMVDEMEVFSQVLSEIQIQTVAQRVPVVDSNVVERCTRACKQATENLSAALYILEKGIRKSSIFGGLKMKLKEGSLNGMRRQLDGATRSLNMARDTYCSALDRYESSILLSNISQLQDQFQKLNDSTSRTEIASTAILAMASQVFTSEKASSDFISPSTLESKQQPPSNTEYCQTVSENVARFHKRESLLQQFVLFREGSWLAYFSGSILYRKLALHSKEAHNSQPTSIYSQEMTFVTWKLPSWLAHMSWEACWTRSCAGWNIKLNVRHIIPDSSPAWDYIRAGNLKGLQGMLTDKQVLLDSGSGSSRESQAWLGYEYKASLLTFAIYCTEVEICEFLIALGADTSATRYTGLTPLGGAVQRLIQASSRRRHSPNSREMEVLKLLLTTGDVDPDSSANNAIGPHFSPFYYSDSLHPDILTILEKHAFPSLTARPFSERLYPFFQYSGGGRFLRLDSLQQCLGNDLVGPTSPTLKADTNWTYARLMGIVAVALGENTVECDYDYPRITIGKALLAKLVAGTTDIYTENSKPSLFGTTHLQSFLEGALIPRGKHPKAENNKALLRGQKDPLRCSHCNTFRSRDGSSVLEISHLVQSWAASLLEAGLTESDVEAYGQKEADWFRRMSIGNSDNEFLYTVRHDPPSSMWLRVISFCVGPKVTDWRAWISDPWADVILGYFAEFWYVVDNPWMQMPGAWLEDVPHRV
ncbi:hypothetical protein BP5796_10258 [Coleophoma crateriformis]|uniref:Fungal N-terminal domain-containing protein n=1 Tax=Coleophoma crateriformis TaxID=565419 RepID=A0A3D8QUQ0_9HELO|nr:hypothetical protein BP5796_10258 [Coleophoma crateriformis]